MSSFPELLGAMLRAQDASDDGAAIPLAEAQADELRKIAGLYGKKAPAYASDEFRRGDIVRWKHRMGPVKGEYRERVAFMFWGYFASDSERARWVETMSEVLRDTQPDPDCLISHFDPAGNFVFMAADSGMLERVP